MFVNTLLVFLVVSYSPSHGKTVPEEGSIIRVRDASEYNKIYHVQRKFMKMLILTTFCFTMENLDSIKLTL